MRWGDFEIDLVSDGTFWLDGGAMFGVVPKVFWERKFPPDQANRIKLGLNCLLVRGNGKSILIDTGCGFKYSSKELEIYGIEHESTVFDDLERLGVAPGDIDLVINTHLHFDHCGGNTISTDKGVAPSFPNAKYVVQLQEYEDASHPSERTQASYLELNWVPLLDRGRLELVEGK
ncbi:MAG TPA: MBL fold metallo-hydrolase, partial [Acidobacteriota bacterium]|nr:MBL fold metallo-hydrolase [Acidobacteriota bacterium]